MIAALLVVLLAQAALLAVIAERLRPTKEAADEVEHDAELCLLIVREAVKERLEHEKERPDRYPVDHRERSILQRARRRMHFAKVKEPPAEALGSMIAKAIREAA